MLVLCLVFLISEYQVLANIDEFGNDYSDYGSDSEFEQGFSFNGPDLRFGTTRAKSSADGYTAWKHSWPTQIPIERTLRYIYCERYHNSTVLGSLYGEQPNKDCRDHFWLFALRNYGCNCFSDNHDYTFLNWRARQFGIRAMHMGNNGEPIDFLDATCRKTHFRFQCLLQDLEAGNYDLVAPADKLKDLSPNNGMTYEMRKQVCEQQDISIHGQELEDIMIWGWQDQCAKMQRYECGLNLEYPEFVDEDGVYHCGWPDNPDYVNGTPPGEECQRDVCLIAVQFANELIDGLQARGYGPGTFDTNAGENGGLWTYTIDHRDNYFVYANHINVTNGQLVSPTRFDGSSTNNFQTWAVEWDMNFDAAGNLPEYFPYEPADFVPTDAYGPQYEPLVHWYKDYSTAPQQCQKRPPKPLPGWSERKCCGVQPERYPYQSASHDCCEGVLRHTGYCS